MRKKSRSRIRYGLVGVGHIAQVAVLPAFAHSKSSELGALISGDRSKLAKLGKRYRVETYDYEDLERAAGEQDLQAVYIALPNTLHAEYTVRAAEAGLHVLCEKPLAMTERDCRRMIDACKQNDVKLMTAYRLHFNETHLKAIDLIRKGKIGEPRIFNSVFTYQIKDGYNIRLDDDVGGGPIWDIGIYCLNAARYLFGDEPLEVSAMSVENSDSRFHDVPEMTAVTLRFPKDRLATFVASFGADAQASLSVVGSGGTLQLDRAYEYAEGIELTLAKDGTRRYRHQFKKVDQFAPELESFSRAVLTGRRIEPDGNEGRLDVRVLQAIERAARTGRTVSLTKAPPKRTRPSLKQAKPVRPVREPKLVNARGAAQ